ncbi:MAG: AAA family ATPase [Thermodesulfobacteriota bacterium]
MNYSQIRHSTIQKLLEKVRKQSYGKYLVKASINRIRGFVDVEIAFDFPVTALIGPNGSGKSSVLGVAGCAYRPIRPGLFFPKSVIGDESMSGWKVEYEIIDKSVNERQTVRRNCNFRQARWVRGDVLDRNVLFFGIERTVPAGEKPKYKKLMRSTYRHRGALAGLDADVAKQVQHILGKSVQGFQVTEIGHDDKFFVGISGESQYSEFHFGAGESSIIRMISEIERAPDNSLILIEEIENGLHPVATRHMAEYLIEAAERKAIQAVFTTHSEYALSPLPNEAIWACIYGTLKQGRLSVEALRAVSGTVEKKLAVFVEDEFAKCWVDSILREQLGHDYEQVEVHAVAGNGNAVATHKAHSANPAVTSRSLCVIDGDSRQPDDPDRGVLRLPGENPELTVFEFVHDRLQTDLAVLTVHCQRAPEAQDSVRKAIEEVRLTNRDPHLIYAEIGIKIGFVPESTVRGAFLALWVRGNQDFCKDFTNRVRRLIDEA